jgi:hypothetical protein
MAEADVPQERSSMPQAQATAGKPTAETSSAQVERTMPLPPRRPWSTGGRLSVLVGLDGWCCFSSASSAQGVFTSHANLKYFLFHPLHRIFGHMHEVLNISKKNK